MSPMVFLFRKPSPYVWLLLGISAAIPLIFVFSTGLVWEDFLITYRFSENLARGHGLVYSPGEHVYGFTSPLNALLPALFAWLSGATDFVLPLWLFRFVSLAGLIVAFVSVTSVLAREHAGSRAAFFACCLFPLMAVLEIKTTAFAMCGQEAGLVLAFLAPAFALVWLGWKESAELGGVLWAGLMYSRPDGCVYIAIIALAALIFETESRRQLVSALVRSGLICAMLYLPWLLFTWAYYGSPIPHTIVAKHGAEYVARFYDSDRTVFGVFGSLAAGIRTVPDMLLWGLAPIYDEAGSGWPRWTHDCEFILESVAILYWLIPTRDRMGRMASLVSFLIFGYLVYVNIAAPHAPWYLPPLAFMSLLTLVAAVAATMRRFAGIPVAKGSAMLALIGVLGLMGFLFVSSLRPLRLKQDLVESGNRRLVGLWLKDHVRKGEGVYLEPLGYIGYFSQCKMLDWPGLVSPEVVAARRKLPSESGYTWSETAELLKPAWIVARPIEARLMQNSKYLTDNYTMAKVFDASESIRSVLGRQPGDTPEFHMTVPDSVYIVFERTGAAVHREGAPVAVKKSLEEMRAMAEKGDASAQLDLGCRYAETGEDPAEAVRWFRKSAEQGNASAQFNLGAVYASGQGVAKDMTEAMRWFRKAAEQGDANGQFNLGAGYSDGEGVARDPVEAARWFRKAAEQGDADAEVKLGLCYAGGSGVEEDPTEAVAWFSRAAGQNDADAQYFLGLCYSDGKGVPKNEEEALAWFEISASAGNASAIEARNLLELRLGKPATLAAMRRSKELLTQISPAR